MGVERERETRYALCYRKKPLKLEFLFKKNHLTHLHKTTLKYLVNNNLLWFENGN